METLFADRGQTEAGDPSASIPPSAGTGRVIVTFPSSGCHCASPRVPRESLLLVSGASDCYLVVFVPSFLGTVLPGQSCTSQIIQDLLSGHVVFYLPVCVVLEDIPVVSLGLVCFVHVTRLSVHFLFIS